MLNGPSVFVRIRVVRLRTKGKQRQIIVPSLSDFDKTLMNIYFESFNTSTKGDEISSNQ